MKNFLPNEEYRLEEGKLVSYERELSKEEVEAITAEYTFSAPETAPVGTVIEGEIGGRKYRVRVEEERSLSGETVKVIKVMGHFTKDGAKSICDDVTKEWWRQQFLIYRVKYAYFRLGERFYDILNSAKIWVKGNTVFIEVPPEYMDELVGKEKVKYVEGKAGCKVRILVEGNVGKEVLREAAKLRRKTDALIQALLE